MAELGRGGTEERGCVLNQKANPVEMMFFKVLPRESSIRKGVPSAHSNH